MNPEREIVNISSNTNDVRSGPPGGDSAVRIGVTPIRIGVTPMQIKAGGAVKEKSRRNRIAKVGKPSFKIGHTKPAKRGGGYMFMYIFIYTGKALSHARAGPDECTKFPLLDHVFPSGPSKCFGHTCGLQQPSVALRPPRVFW